jgi:uncharacterized peroxidase-related enzyme
MMTMPFVRSLSKGASLLDLFKAFPETSIPLIQFHEALLRRPSPFTEGERELIAAYVSGLNRCRYCHGVHSATAEVLGIKPELVDSRLDIDTAGVDPKVRPVLRYARKLTEQPSSLTQADADAIFAEGWEEAALYYTVAVTALFNFMNRLVEGMGIELCLGGQRRRGRSRPPEAREYARGNDQANSRLGPSRVVDA